MHHRLANSLEILLGEIDRSAPGRNKEHDQVGVGSVFSNRPSDHNPCICHRVICAMDFTHDPTMGFDALEFADWLAKRLKSGQEGRVKFIISNGRICAGAKQPYRPGIWREYKGVDQHITHVHVSVAHPQGVFDYPEEWGWDLHCQAQ